MHQFKDQLISISTERQKSACSPTPQGRTEVRPQRAVTEQPSHLVSFHLFLTHTENLLSQSNAGPFSALGFGNDLNEVKCTGVPVPLLFAWNQEPLQVSSITAPVPTGRAVTTEGASKPSKKGFSTSYRNSLRPKEPDL